ncbi:hypothetical protein ASE88_04275 [Sphingomonas sp. Leaf38]|nr:hypothetical protein ASE88_04275 [Sphingomonas sp. Leaf38]
MTAMTVLLVYRGPFPHQFVMMRGQQGNEKGIFVGEVAVERRRADTCLSRDRIHGYIDAFGIERLTRNDQNMRAIFLSVLARRASGR